METQTSWTPNIRMLNQLTKNGIKDSLQNSCREGRRRAIWVHLLQTVPGASTIFLHHQPLHSCHVTDVPELYGLPPVSGLQGNGWDNQFHVCWSSPSTCRSCQRPWLKPPNRSASYILFITVRTEHLIFSGFLQRRIWDFAENVSTVQLRKWTERLH